MIQDVVRFEGGLADRSRWTTERCSLAAALGVVATRTAFLILREAFYGTRRFDDFAARVQVTEAVAAARLRELVEAGLLRREPYREPGQRTRHEYLLTEMGRDLFPALLALTQWGDRYLAGDQGAPLHFRHDGCGEQLRVDVRCAADHAVPLDEVAVRSGRRPRRR